MIDLSLIGIGTGNPDHLTRQAIRALNAADLILIPHKGDGKTDLADLRRSIVAEVVTNPATRIVTFDLPVRDAATADYRRRVEDWHDAIAALWASEIAAHLGATGRVALLVWGDPSLYDSTLRIAARLRPAPQVTVVPGITSIQALTAAHAIPLNEINGPVMITTGRRLRDDGFPPGTDTCVVMLDGQCSFQSLPPDGLEIWWAGFAGMPEQITERGPLAKAGPRILERRAAARAEHGWIMDIYLLRRTAQS
ncbi:precorrin-6A synthase (deacetylating) [Gemmobacter fulvus]|uniref:precorrin-6A synthase (deacetylating) n=1 Tax=Gemmobacter fulvus TaxID=2840474 RepID=UPI002796DA3D|nr:precorrin-6A synthase (deacetylating) [Gemmobacter fulvus]MDQ1849262.1 precorrin-6A synthase (deacetylating) [Gemmobacter fulvus]